MKTINFYKKMLLFICLFLLIWFLIWNRFKVRDAKSLPIDFNNLTYGFYISVIISFILTIIAITYFFYTDRYAYRKNIIYSYYLNIINFIKDNFDSFINNKRISSYIVRTTNYFFLHSRYLWFLYLFTNYFIRIFVVSVLIIDIFYLNNIFNFYKVLPLLFLPLIFRILFYCIKRNFDLQCNLIAPKIQILSFYKSDSIFAEIVTVNLYVHINAMLYLNKSKDPFLLKVILDPDFVANLVVLKRKIDYNGTKEKFEFALGVYTRYYIVLYLVEKNRLIYDKYINLLIRLGYFFSWSYVLWLSDPLIVIIIIKFLLLIPQYISEPFSGLLLT